MSELTNSPSKIRQSSEKLFLVQKWVCAISKRKNTEARPPWPFLSLKFVSIPLSIARKRSPMPFNRVRSCKTQYESGKVAELEPLNAFGDISTASTYSVLSSRCVDWFSLESM